MADVMVVTEMGQASAFFVCVTRVFQARGEKVATYKGVMQLGTWGPGASGA